MSDSDDDLPPPLEDMTEKVEKISERKQKYLHGLQNFEEQKHPSYNAGENSR